MGEIDGNAYFQGVFQRPAVVQAGWTTGQRTNDDVTPPHSRSNGPPDRTRRCKCLFSKGSLNVHPLERPFANGPTDDLPRIRRKAVCVSGRKTPTTML